MSTCAEASTAVLIFARAPVAGHTKTRLIPLLGADGAARLHARMIERALTVACEASLGPVELWCLPSTAHPFFAGCAGRHSASLHAQVGTSLGARLRHAHRDAFGRHARILLIGTDSPALTAEHLRRAAAALRQHDAVLVPAEDGGYVLLGLSAVCAHAFTDIDWSTARVSQQTLARLQEAERSCRVMETLWDVDRPEDYRRLISLLPTVAGDQATALFGDAAARRARPAS